MSGSGAERAEINSVPLMSLRERHGRHLTPIQHIEITVASISDIVTSWTPRDPLRVLGGGLLAVGAISVSNTAIVRAAGQDCSNTYLDMVGLGYVKNPLIPTRDIKQPDAADIVVGSPEIGVVVIERPDNPQDPNSIRSEVTRDNLVNRGRFSDKLFKLAKDGAWIKSNTSKDGKPAVEVYWYAENDRLQLNTETGKTEKPRGKAVVTCGLTRPASLGRYASDEILAIALNNPDYKFETVAAIINDSFKRKVGQSAGLGPETVSQAEVRRALKEYLEKQKNQTPTPTPTGTPRGIETPTPTGTRPAASPTATKTPETPTATATTVPASPTPTPAAGGGIGPDLSGVKEIPGVGGIVQAGGFILDLPAKAIDQVTEPDTQFPLRAGIDVLAWLVLLRLLKRVPRVGIVGIPGAYILGASSYIFRFGIAKWRYNRAVATAAAAVPPGVVPAWVRPTLPI